MAHGGLWGSCTLHRGMDLGTGRPLDQTAPTVGQEMVVGLGTGKLEDQTQAWELCSLSMEGRGHPGRSRAETLCYGWWCLLWKRRGEQRGRGCRAEQKWRNWRVH